jgi:hypothetical protein
MNVARLGISLTVSLLATSPVLADDILGTWLRDSGDEQVKFGPCGDVICGDIVWLKPDSDLNAKVGKRLFFDMRPSGPNSCCRQSRQLRHRVNPFRQDVCPKIYPDHLGLHRRQTDLQAGELEKSALIRDRPRPFQPVGYQPAFSISSK